VSTKRFLHHLLVTFILIGSIFGHPAFAQKPFNYKYPKIRPLSNPFADSLGYIMGTILNIQDEGMAVWRYRYEGSMMVGIGTQQGPLRDVECAVKVKMAYDAQRKRETEKTPGELFQRITDACTLLINPWRFSYFDERITNFYKSIHSTMVVVYYVHLPLAPQGLFTDTRHFVRGIWKVDPKLKIEPSREVKWYRIPVSRHLTAEKGIVEGRVVKATLEDPIRKTFEITVQQGERSDNFRPLSVSDPDLFDYIVRTMFTGRMVRIEYVKIFALSNIASNLAGFETYYRVTKVTLLDFPDVTK